MVWLRSELSTDCEAGSGLWVLGCGLRIEGPFRNSDSTEIPHLDPNHLSQSSTLHLHVPLVNSLTQNREPTTQNPTGTGFAQTRCVATEE